jgi:hypothetical protein
VTATTGVFLEAGDFAMGRCRECRREVLTYPDGDPDSLRRCIHCDELVSGELRWIDVADLGPLGYEVDGGEGGGGGCATCASGCVVRSVSQKKGS